MKKTLLFVCAALAISTHSIAQCSELKEKKDSFSGKKERTASMTVGNLLTKWSVDFMQVDGKNSMKWGIAMQGEFNQRFEAGTPMMLKLEDGTIVTVNTSQPSSPVTKVSNGGAGTVNVFSIYYLTFDLDKATLKKLANSPIEDLKIDIPGQEIKNPKLKGKQMANMQDIFTCMLNS